MLTHRHLIVRCELAEPPVTVQSVQEWLVDLVSKIRMRIMSGPHVAYCAMPGNRGVTGVVVIETSHIALHVWDETDPALLQLDVYTCSELDPKIIADCLQQWRPTAIEYKFLDRDSALREIDSGTM